MPGSSQHSSDSNWIGERSLERVEGKEERNVSRAEKGNRWEGREGKGKEGQTCSLFLP